VGIVWRNGLELGVAHAGPACAAQKTDMPTASTNIHPAACQKFVVGLTLSSNACLTNRTRSSSLKPLSQCSILLVVGCLVNRVPCRG